MDKELIKNQVKMDLGGALVINPNFYSDYLEWLSVTYCVSRDEARDIAKEALSELPPYLD
jgi:hypothetical protein